MLSSLSARFLALGGIVVAAMLVLTAMLVTAAVETRTSFLWVEHSAQVIERIDETLGAIRNAESGQRGYLLTHDISLARDFDADVRSAGVAAVQLQRLTADNPSQNRRAKRIRALVASRIALLRDRLQLGRAGHFDEAARLVAYGNGRSVMVALTDQTFDMKTEERDLLTQRVDRATDHLAWIKLIVLIGGPLVIALITGSIVLMIRSIRRPIATIIAAMNQLATGHDLVRVDRTMGSHEFDGLAHGYNAMADGLNAAHASRADSEIQLQSANVELRARGEELQSRGRVIELLGGMAHRMQAARTDEELAAVIRVFVPQVLPGIPGALFAHNNSRNLLVRIADWGDTADRTGTNFAPDECWALRRGRSHFITAPGTDIVCAHVHDPQMIYHCEPLLAGGEVIGLLYLEGVVENENRFRMTVLAENIASALVNHRLQRGLREQTIRDPLTGLFNRRYLEEALALEIARAQRSGAPLSLVMCDVDHFKRFNDEFGHDAGDALLQAVAAEMRSHFRDGDVACRYGGEEFTIIAPGATQEAIAERVELLRVVISELSVRQVGRVLGSISMSFGIAQWNEHMDREGATLIQTADAALYRAKAAGRNRLIMAEKLAA